MFSLWEELLIDLLLRYAQVLHLMAKLGHHVAIENLLSEGADVNIVDRWGRTALQEVITATPVRFLGLVQSHKIRKGNRIHMPRRGFFMKRSCSELGHSKGPGATRTHFPQ